MPVCDCCGIEREPSEGMKASNSTGSIWLCGRCILRQSNGYEVMDDLD